MSAREPGPLVIQVPPCRHGAHCFVVATGDPRDHHPAPAAVCLCGQSTYAAACEPATDPAADRAR